MSDLGTVPISVGESEWVQVTPTPQMRFVRKGGKLILQQMITMITPTSMTSRWVDVPIEENP